MLSDVYKYIIRQQEEQRAMYEYRKWQEIMQYDNYDLETARRLQNQILGGGFQETDSPASPQKTLQLIKKSIKEIKAEEVSPEMQEKVGNKINRLKTLGATTQALILENELKLRARLAGVREWDYKVLPCEEIGKFNDEHKMTATKDGLKIHIQPLQDYAGNTTITADKKDRIIPDFVLDKLAEAKERQIFNDFSVLWVEEIKDPLLLGTIEGCKDYFFIAEWGEDIKFEDIIKEEK